MELASKKPYGTVLPASIWELKYFAIGLYLHPKGGHAASGIFLQFNHYCFCPPAAGPFNGSRLIGIVSKLGHAGGGVMWGLLFVGCGSELLLNSRVDSFEVVQCSLHCHSLAEQHVTADYTTLC